MSRQSIVSLAGALVISAGCASGASQAVGAPEPQERSAQETPQQAYAKVITAEAESDSGLFTVHRVGPSSITRFPIRCSGATCC